MPGAEPVRWEDINFYNNPFSDDVGNLLLGRLPAGETLDLVSPCNTSDGWLPKKWKIIKEERVLIKGGSGLPQQEPFNEVVAAAICRRLDIPHVPYSILWERGKSYNVCPNMTNDRQDLVSAYHIQAFQKRSDHRSLYDHFLACCDTLGIPDVQPMLDRMLILDYLICNQDRHFGNFGAIRDAVTLEWQGLAPIYGSGTSLWHESYAAMIHGRGDAAAKPFAKTHAKQILLAEKTLRERDLSALHGIKEESLVIFEQAHFGEPKRAAALSNALAERCERLQEIAHEKRQPSAALSALCADAKR